MWKEQNIGYARDFASKQEPRVTFAASVEDLGEEGGLATANVVIAGEEEEENHCVIYDIYDEGRGV